MENDTTAALLTKVWASLRGGRERLAAFNVRGVGSLPSEFPVTELATSAIGAAALAAAELVDRDASPLVVVDRALASYWFGWSLAPVGWEPPSPWDSIAGDYRAADRWIRLHTNAPHHRAAALGVLACAPDRETVARTVAAFPADELEAVILGAGGCAATMRSIDEWRRHPAGSAVSGEPLVEWRDGITDPAIDTTPVRPVDVVRPLAGMRVLDLTRVLAGPVATRFLAALGADVLRIDPPTWDEPGVIPEVTVGKRCARLDLRNAEDHARLVSLLAAADIIVHGYRPGALAGLGLDEEERQAIRPGLVDVSLDAYGWSGPWADRRGFDSLVQMSCGIADAGMHAAGADHPVPLPVQALDHATGYLMAAAALRGLTRRQHDGFASIARLSLARTANLLIDAPLPSGANAPLDAPTTADAVEATSWGPARRLLPPFTIDGVHVGWDSPATSLGSSTPVWNEPAVR